MSITKIFSPVNVMTRIDRVNPMPENVITKIDRVKIFSSVNARAFVDHAKFAARVEGGRALVCALDARRKAIGISRIAWASEANVDERNVRKILTGKVACRPVTIAKLRKALDRLENGRHQKAQEMPIEAVEAIFNGLVVAASSVLKIPPQLAVSISPQNSARGVVADSVTRLAHQARAVALYLANVQVGIPQAALSKALKIDKGAISRTISKQEDERDDADFEYFIQRTANLMNQGDVL